MISLLPNDILISIIRINAGLVNGYHQYMEIDIREIIKLRNINNDFRKLIDSINNLWEFKNNMDELPKIYYNRIYKNKILKWTDYNYNSRLSIDEQFNEICKKNTSIESIKWLFQNNIFLSLKNIKYLIINNRINVINMCLEYEENRRVIFNRFHIAEILDKNDDILSKKEILHPLIIAGNYGRIDIIDMLLNLNYMKYCFNKEIPRLLDISIKFNHEKLLTYLVINYYNNISETLQNKISSIINRVDNCQGLLFYLISSDKVKVSHKLLVGCIIKSYYDLFKFFYRKKPFDNINSIELIKECIHYNNVEIINYLMDECHCIISPEKFSFYFFKKRTYSKEFISNIVNKYKDYIKKTSNLIYLSIKYDIHELLIKDLIFNNYNYTNEEIKLAVDLNKYCLVEYMCQYIKEKK